MVSTGIGLVATSASLVAPDKVAAPLFIGGVVLAALGAWRFYQGRKAMTDDDIPNHPAVVDVADVVGLKIGSINAFGTGRGQLFKAKRSSDIDIGSMLDARSDDDRKLTEGHPTKCEK